MWKLSSVRNSSNLQVLTADISGPRLRLHPNATVLALKLPLSNSTHLRLHSTLPCTRRPCTTRPPHSSKLRTCLRQLPAHSPRLKRTTPQLTTPCSIRLVDKLPEARRPRDTRHNLEEVNIITITAKCKKGSQLKSIISAYATGPASQQQQQQYPSTADLNGKHSKHSSS